MHKSIVTNFFVVCATAIIAGVIIIASILLIVASEFYKTEKKEALLANMYNVIDATKLSYLSSQNSGTDEILYEYRKRSSQYNTEFTLADSDNKIIVSSIIGNKDELPKEINLSNLKYENGKYFFSVNTLDGFYENSNINVIMPFSYAGIRYYLIGSSSAESLYDFIIDLGTAMIIVSLIVLFIFGFIIYLTMKKMLSPLEEMSLVAKKYGHGDFSVELDTSYPGEIGALAESINDMSHSLANLENTRKSFIANVSHELKTPMTSIGGFVDGILDGTIPKEEERKYLKIVSQEVNRLSRLVRSMLNIAKYETGEIQMVKTKFDIVSLTIKTLLLFENKIEDKGVDIRGLDTDPVLADADIDLIQQILYNLIENAVKFVNQNGYISFYFTKNEKDTTVSIRNSGDGLTQDEMPKVFDRFYKTDESHGKDKTGVGLGLSIVRSIINLHNGTILVTSKKGKYTEFTFSIPNDQ